MNHVIWIIIAFLLKYTVMIILASILYEKFESVIVGLSASWILTWYLIYLGIFVLSGMSNLSRNYLILYMIIICSIITAYYRYKYHSGVSKKVYYFCKCCQSELKKLYVFDVLAILIFLLVAAYVIIHSLYFFDCSPDAYCYGITRIELWATHKNVFTTMNSVAKNIFCNEWNGELCSLYYAVIAKSSDAIMFGNADNFLNSLLLLSATCENIFGKKRNSFLVAASIACAPILLSMAMEVKGDYLLMIVMPLAFSFLIRVLQTDISLKSNYEIFFCLLSFAMSGGAKMNALSAAGIATVIIAITCIIRRNKKQLMIFVAGVVVSSIGYMRYCVNFFVYGNPLERIEIERTQLREILPSMLCMIADIKDYSRFTKIPGAIIANDLDYGFLSIIILPFCLIMIFIGIKLVFQKRIIIRWGYVLGLIAIVFSLLSCMSLMGYGILGFLRYYAGWTNTLLLLLFGFSLIYWEKESNVYRRVKTTFSVVVLCFLCLNTFNSISLVSSDGEVTIGTISDAKKKSVIERQYACHSYLLDYPDVEDIGDVMPYLSGGGKRVLVCNYVASIVSYMFGDDMNNDVIFCIPKELPDLIDNNQFDVIAISSEFMGETTVIPYDAAVYPSASLEWDPGSMDKMLREEYKLYKPVPEALRMYVYVREK